MYIVYILVLLRDDNEDEALDQFAVTEWNLQPMVHAEEQMSKQTMFFMGGTHFVQLWFQLAHIPLYFLYGGSVEAENKKVMKQTAVMTLYHCTWVWLRGVNTQSNTDGESLCEEKSYMSWNM